VQRIKKQVGNNWGHVIIVLLNQFNKSHGHSKFKYDVIDTNWVDVDFLIHTIIMNYEKEKDMYWLNCVDSSSLNEFMTNNSL
jgi:hypothetical protein